MAIIRTQHEAKERRRRIAFCYLCGRSICTGDDLLEEHIVPLTVLRRSGASHSQAWPVKLDVHAACEHEIKRDDDEIVSLTKNLFLPPEEIMRRANEAMDKLFNNIKGGDSAAAARLTESIAAAMAGANEAEELYRAVCEFIDGSGIPSRDRAEIRSRVAPVFGLRQVLHTGHYRKTLLEVLAEQPVLVEPARQLSEEYVALAGFEIVFRAVWTWVRGFHAFCYGNFLPSDAPHRVFFPKMTFAGVDDPRDLLCIEMHSAITDALQRQDDCAVDGITFWNDECQYRCAWIPLEGEPLAWRCLWSIVMPGLDDLREFSGGYITNSRPSGGALVKFDR